MDEAQTGAPATGAEGEHTPQAHSHKGQTFQMDPQMLEQYFCAPDARAMQANMVAEWCARVTGPPSPLSDPQQLTS